MCAMLAGVLLWQAAHGFDSSTAPTQPDSPAPGLVGAVSAIPPAANPLVPGSIASPGLPAFPSADPTATQTAPPSAMPSPRTQWAADAALVQAKNDGRVIIDSSGQVVIVASTPTAPVYPTAASLDTSWSGLIQEPPRIGRDARGVAYRDDNYIRFCGPGVATVVLYYWAASKSNVKTMSGTFKEPVNLGAGKYASTYWTAEDPGGYGRGMMMYLGEVQWPTPDKGLSWWAHPGIMRWTVSKPDTYVENLVDGINWEASGRMRLNYFYVIVHASDLTAQTLRARVHADITMGVPVVIAARTSDGTNHLPAWRVRSKAPNHFVSVVGYDDAAGTYAVLDTCGLRCNDRNLRVGVRNMSQAALFALIRDESDNDGIMW